MSQVCEWLVGDLLLEVLLCNRLCRSCICESWNPQAPQGSAITKGHGFTDEEAKLIG